MSITFLVFWKKLLLLYKNKIALKQESSNLCYIINAKDVPIREYTHSKIKVKAEFSLELSEPPQAQAVKFV